MVCPICHSTSLTCSTAWCTCLKCNHVDLVVGFWKCPYRNLGCAHAEGCQRLAHKVKECGFFAYFQFLEEFNSGK